MKALSNNFNLTYFVTADPLFCDAFLLSGEGDFCNFLGGVCECDRDLCLLSFRGEREESCLCCSLLGGECEESCLCCSLLGGECNESRLCCFLLGGECEETCLCCSLLGGECEESRLCCSLLWGECEELCLCLCVSLLSPSLLVNGDLDRDLC